jgi:hypothetical protein
MSHESVWYSRPRNYGKGSREWYVYTYIYTLSEDAHHVGSDLLGIWAQRGIG